MGELLPILLGGAVRLVLGRRSARLTVAIVLALGVAASAINGELVSMYGPVFVVIDATLAWLGYTGAGILVQRFRRPAQT